ncbi:MAG: hypothetical protein WBO77_01560 [Microgenomates group bacterium]
MKRGDVKRNLFTEFRGTSLLQNLLTAEDIYRSFDRGLVTTDEASRLIDEQVLNGVSTQDRILLDGDPNDFESNGTNDPTLLRILRKELTEGISLREQVRNSADEFQFSRLSFDKNNGSSSRNGKER